MTHGPIVYSEEKNLPRNNITSFEMKLRSVILAAHIFSAISEIIVRPRDTEAVVGQATFLNCSASDLSKGIRWYYYPPSQHVAIIIYSNGRMQPPYKDTAQLDINNDTGAFNLVIFEVQRTHSGRYLCQEEGEDGQHGTAELVVLHTNPVCHSSMNLKELIGPNDCNIEPEELRLSCTVEYSGNKPPVMEWKATKEDETVVGQITPENKGNNVTYHMTKKIDLSMNGSSYLCQTTRTAAIRQLAKPNCTSDVLRILYAFSQNLTVNASVGDSRPIVCAANTNVACNYKWKWFKGDDMTTESSSATLRPTKQGSHKCEATCNIKNHSCTMLPMTALVSANEDEWTSSDRGSIAWIVILVVIVVILILAAVILAVYVLQKKRAAMMRADRIRSDAVPLNGIPENSIMKKEDEMQLEENKLLQVVNPPTLDDIDPKSLISSLPLLAKGMSGAIYGPWEFDNKKYVWEKILLPPQIKDTRKAEIRGQAEKWKDLEHNNLIRFQCIRFQSTALCIMMDYAAGGTVRKVLDNSQQNLPDQVARDWAIQIAEGMQYLHEHDILHRQLKCGRILLMEHFDPLTVTTNVLKIGIGSFRTPVEDGESNQSVTKDAYQWMPPEVLKGNPYRKSSEIWSYGVTVWEILTRETPHKGVKFGPAVSEIISGSRNLQIPESCSSDLKVILTGCLNRDETGRPTFPEILSRLHRYDLAETVETQHLLST